LLWYLVWCLLLWYLVWCLLLWYLVWCLLLWYLVWCLLLDSKLLDNGGHMPIALHVAFLPFLIATIFYGGKCMQVSM